MKRLLCLMLTLVMIIPISGCGKTEEEKWEESEIEAFDECFEILFDKGTPATNNLNCAYYQNEKVIMYGNASNLFGYNLEDGKIVSGVVCMKYADKEHAMDSYNDIVRSGDTDEINRSYVAGPYLVCNMKEDAIEDLTTEGVMFIYMLWAGTSN